jgi:hypothetical protein
VSDLEFLKKLIEILNQEFLIVVGFKLVQLTKLSILLSGPAVSTLRRAIVEVKQRRSDIGWVTKKLLSLARPCFGRHVKPLVLAEFTVVNTHQLSLGPHGGLWPVLLMCKP